MRKIGAVVVSLISSLTQKFTNNLGWTIIDESNIDTIDDLVNFSPFYFLDLKYRRFLMTKISISNRSSDSIEKYN